MKGILPFSGLFVPSLSKCLEERSPRSVSAELSMDNSWATWKAAEATGWPKQKSTSNNKMWTKSGNSKNKTLMWWNSCYLALWRIWLMKPMDLRFDICFCSKGYLLLQVTSQLNYMIQFCEGKNSKVSRKRLIHIDSFCSMLLTPHRFEPAMWLFLCWHWKYMKTHEHAKKHLPSNGRNTRENKHETSPNLEKHEVTKQQDSQVWLLMRLIAENMIKLRKSYINTSSILQKITLKINTYLPEDLNDKPYRLSCPPSRNCGEWGFVGIPYKKCNNPGGECYWEGATPKINHINHYIQQRSSLFSLKLLHFGHRFLP